MSSFRLTEVDNSTSLDYSLIQQEFYEAKTVR